MTVTTSLFSPYEAFSSGRIVLSALDDGAIETMPWLGAALAPDWTPDDLREARLSQAGVLIADAQGEALGIALVALDTPAPAAASIPFLAIDPVRRFRGLGGEAGLAIERHIRSRMGTTRFYAPVPDGRGLAVYFWLRLGYRPLLASESPGALVGLTDAPLAGIWMARETE